MKYDTIVAIDPDVDKSGVAELSPQNRLLEVTSLTFPQLMDYLQARKNMSEAAHTSLVVVVEAGWLNSSNWHLKDGDSKRIASAKGNSTGRNHETGRKIVDMCRHYGIETVEMRPLKKNWKGKDGKIAHEELALFTGLTGRTNQEARDAGLIAWIFAGLPIRIQNSNEKKCLKTG